MLSAVVFSLNNMLHFTNMRIVCTQIRLLTMEQFDLGSKCLFLSHTKYMYKSKATLLLLFYEETTYIDTFVDEVEAWTEITK